METILVDLQARDRLSLCCAEQWSAIMSQHKIAGTTEPRPSRLPTSTVNRLHRQSRNSGLPIEVRTISTRRGHRYPWRLRATANLCKPSGTASLGMRSDGEDRASYYTVFSSTRYWIESKRRCICVDAMICRLGPGSVGSGCQVMQAVSQGTRLVRTSAMYLQGFHQE